MDEITPSNESEFLTKLEMLSQYANNEIVDFIENDVLHNFADTIDKINVDQRFINNSDLDIVLGFIYAANSLYKVIRDNSVKNIADKDRVSKILDRGYLLELASILDLQEVVEEIKKLS